ncbi:hypothetical protein [Streptomyces sp. NBC_00272]|uniref:hypothetical protein n=1 Tax=Streptomyces sp. NBC_00272 TaxID=2975698 RepID=UPI002E2B57CD|nr:hypothetical protein [Streptomyces sp. NBC_00272]
MSWWSKVLRDRATSWHFAPLETSAGTERRPIPPDEAYLNAFLTSMHIADVRVATRKFYGAVTSSFSVSTRAGGSAEFVVVTTPTVLKNIDAQNLDRVITVDKRLLGPVPYRGGGIDLEIGLFSMPAADLLEPYLNLVEDISKLAGVGLVTGGVPLVPTVKAAINALLGSQDNPRLELGVAATFAEPHTGYYCAVRADRNKVGLEDISLSRDRRLIHSTDGGEVTEPYLVFELTCSEQRGDWASIPEVLTSYQEVRGAAKRGELEGAKQALALFGRTVVFCTDLLMQDGKRLRDLVSGEVDKAFPATVTGGRPGTDMPELSELLLFSNPPETAHP